MIRLLVGVVGILTTVALLMAWLGPVVDAIATPDDRWKAAGRSKIGWIAAILLLGPVVGILYLVLPRPKVSGQSVGRGFADLGRYYLLVVLPLTGLFLLYLVVEWIVSNPDSIRVIVGFVGILAAIALLVAWLGPVVDAIATPGDRWKAAGRSKIGWIAAILLLGPVVGILYLALARPEVSGRSVGRGFADLGWYYLLTVLSLIVLFPIYMVLVRALSQPISYLSAGQPPRPVAPEWDVFARAFTEGDLGGKLLISAVATVVIAGAQVATSILAAYAFAFLRFPFRRTAFVAFMATLMLPIEVTLIANVETIRDLGWFNSYQGLTAPFLAAAFGTFLIRQGFLGIPDDLRDAAELDGFGHLGFLRNVAIPVSRPIIASFTVIAFLSAWNQYLWPRAIVTRDAWDTVQIALPKFAGENINEFNLGFAAAIIAALPILAILIFFQKHLIRGLTAGAVKG